jgi:hypothetical protein
MQAQLVISCDPTDSDDVERAIARLQEASAQLRARPAGESAAQVDADKLEAAVAELLNHGPIRMAAIDALAAAGEEGVPVADLVALLPHARSLNGLRSSMKRGWKGSGGLRLVGDAISRSGGRYRLNPAILPIVRRMRGLD